MYQWNYPYIEPIEFSFGFSASLDNGYLFVGHQRQDIIIDDEYLRHGVMKKVNLNGEDVWEYVSGDSNTFGSLIGCFQTQDGGYLSFGGTGYKLVFDSFNEVSEATLAYFGIIKINSAGHKVWENHYTYSADDEDYPAFTLKSIVNNDNGHYIFGSFSRGRQDISRPFLMSINNEGDSIGVVYYEFEYEEESPLRFWKILPSLDSTFIIAGEQIYQHELSQLDSSRLVLARIDTQGEINWKYEYTGEGIETIRGLCRSEENFLLMCGWRYFYDNNNREVYPGICIVLKINVDGELVWKREYTSQSLRIEGSYPFFYSVQFDADGNYLLVGSITSEETETSDVLLVKLNPDGDVLWSCTYNNYFWERNLSDVLPSIVSAHGGGYVILCKSYQHGVQGGLWLFKTEPDFVSVPDVRLPLPAAEMSVYPNPFSDFLSVQLPPSLGGHWSVRLFDLQGRVVYSISNLSSGRYNTGAFIDLQNLNSIPSGAYFLDLRDQNSLIGRTQIWKFK